MPLVLVFNRTLAQYFAGYISCTMSVHDLVGGYMKGGRSRTEMNCIFTLIRNKAPHAKFLVRKLLKIFQKIL